MSLLNDGAVEYDDMMTITEAAAALQVTRASVYAAVANGRIRSRTLLGRQVVSRSDVQAYQPRAYEGKRENLRPLDVKGPGGSPSHHGPRRARNTVAKGESS